MGSSFRKDKFSVFYDRMSFNHNLMIIRFHMHFFHFYMKSQPKYLSKQKSKSSALVLKLTLDGKLFTVARGTRLAAAPNGKRYGHHLPPLASRAELFPSLGRSAPLSLLLRSWPRYSDYRTTLRLRSLDGRMFSEQVFLPLSPCCT